MKKKKTEGHSNNSQRTQKQKQEQNTQEKKYLIQWTNKHDEQKTPHYSKEIFTKERAMHLVEVAHIHFTRANHRIIKANKKRTGELI